MEGERGAGEWEWYIIHDSIGVSHVFRRRKTERLKREAEAAKPKTNGYVIETLGSLPCF